MWRYVIMLGVVFWSAKARPQQGGSYIGVDDYSFSYESKDGVHKLQAQMFNGKWQVRGSFSWIGNDGKMYTTNFIVDPQGYRSGVIDEGFTTQRPLGGYQLSFPAAGFSSPAYGAGGYGGGEGSPVSPVPTGGPGSSSISGGATSSILGLGK